MDGEGFHELEVRNPRCSGNRIHDLIDNAANRDAFLADNDLAMFGLGVH